jgi:hypothetical protein
LGINVNGIRTNVFDKPNELKKECIDTYILLYEALSKRCLFPYEKLLFDPLSSYIKKNNILDITKLTLKQKFILCEIKFDELLQLKKELSQKPTRELLQEDKKILNSLQQFILIANETNMETFRINDIKQLIVDLENDNTNSKELIDIRRMLLAKFFICKQKNQPSQFSQEELKLLLLINNKLSHIINTKNPIQTLHTQLLPQITIEQDVKKQEDYIRDQYEYQELFGIISKEDLNLSYYGLIAMLKDSKNKYSQYIINYLIIKSYSVIAMKYNEVYILIEELRKKGDDKISWEELSIINNEESKANNESIDMEKSVFFDSMEQSSVNESFIANSDANNKRQKIELTNYEKIIEKAIKSQPSLFVFESARNNEWWSLEEEELLHEYVSSIFGDFFNVITNMIPNDMIYINLSNVPIQIHHNLMENIPQFPDFSTIININLDKILLDDSYGDQQSVQNLKHLINFVQLYQKKIDYTYELMFPDLAAYFMILYKLYQLTQNQSEPNKKKILLYLQNKREYNLLKDYDFENFKNFKDDNYKFYSCQLANQIIEEQVNINHFHSNCTNVNEELVMLYIDCLSNQNIEKTQFVTVYNYGEKYFNTAHKITESKHLQYYTADQQKVTTYNKLIKEKKSKHMACTLDMPKFITDYNPSSAIIIKYLQNIQIKHRYMIPLSKGEMNVIQLILREIIAKKDCDEALNKQMLELFSNDKFRFDLAIAATPKTLIIKKSLSEHAKESFSQYNQVIQENKQQSQEGKEAFDDLLDNLVKNIKQDDLIDIIHKIPKNVIDTLKKSDWVNGCLARYESQEETINCYIVLKHIFEQPLDQELRNKIIKYLEDKQDSILSNTINISNYFTYLIQNLLNEQNDITLDINKLVPISPNIIKTFHLIIKEIKDIDFQGQSLQYKINYCIIQHKIFNRRDFDKLLITFLLEKDKKKHNQIENQLYEHITQNKEITDLLDTLNLLKGDQIADICKLSKLVQLLINQDNLIKQNLMMVNLLLINFNNQVRCQIILKLFTNEQFTAQQKINYKLFEIITNEINKKNYTYKMSDLIKLFAQNEELISLLNNKQTPLTDVEDQIIKQDAILKEEKTLWVKINNFLNKINGATFTTDQLLLLIQLLINKDNLTKDELEKIASYIKSQNGTLTIESLKNDAQTTLQQRINYQLFEIISTKYKNNNDDIITLFKSNLELQKILSQKQDKTHLETEITNCRLPPPLPPPPLPSPKTQIAHQALPSTQQSFLQSQVPQHIPPPPPPPQQTSVSLQFVPQQQNNISELLGANDQLNTQQISSSSRQVPQIPPPPMPPTLTAFQPQQLEQLSLLFNQNDSLNFPQSPPPASQSQQQSSVIPVNVIQPLENASLQDSESLSKIPPFQLQPPDNPSSSKHPESPLNKSGPSNTFELDKESPLHPKSQSDKSSSHSQSQSDKEDLSINNSPKHSLHLQDNNIYQKSHINRKVFIIIQQTHYIDLVLWVMLVSIGTLAINYLMNRMNF